MCKTVYPDFGRLYSIFEPAITSIDCGLKCAPYNEYGKPFCCDITHAVPAAYQVEWDFLQNHTDLWHLWADEDPEETTRLWAEAPEGQVLIECQGYQYCQRAYRTITCRSFPFFPYVTLQKGFIGMSYYWQYEDRCWVISHLDQVTPGFWTSFMAAYDAIFQFYPQELDNFRYHSIVMRRVFGRRKRTIPLLHRDGVYYQVSPSNGQLRRVKASSFSKYGPYAIASRMPFPDECVSFTTPR